MTYSGPVSAILQRQLAVSADVKQVTLNSKGLPGPLKITDGQVSWEKNEIKLNNFHAGMGKSQIADLSATFSMNGNDSIEVACKKATLFTGEVYPFLASFDKFQPDLKEVSTTEGTLTLSDVNLKGPINAPARWHCTLTAAMQQIAVQSAALGDPVTIKEGSFRVATLVSGKDIRQKVVIKNTGLSWGENDLTLQGQMNFSRHDVLLEIEADAKSLAWGQINDVLDYIAEKKAKPERNRGKTNLLGTVRVKSDSFIWDTYSMRSLEAEIIFRPDTVAVAVGHADICGLSFKGLMNVSDNTLDIYLVPSAADANLASSLSCLTAKKDLATGTFEFSGEILAKAKPEDITRSLSGELAFSASKGRIYRFGLLAKLLAILNVTEIYRGQVPDLAGDGFAYHSMSASAKLQSGKIIMEDCSIDGASMGIACEGEIDLADKKMNLVILVAPFKTVDRIVDIIPLIGGILGGKLISIPFRAKGDLDDPDVYALSPTAVGSGILGMLERTLKLPITIIQPVIGGMKGGKPRQQTASENSPR
jgi:hypothetical protein